MIKENGSPIIIELMKKLFNLEDEDEKTWMIGTRGSKLALKQTEIVVTGLQRAYPDYVFHIKTIKTTGDSV